MLIPYVELILHCLEEMMCEPILKPNTQNLDHNPFNW